MAPPGRGSSRRSEKPLGVSAIPLALSKALDHLGIRHNSCDKNGIPCCSSRNSPWIKFLLDLRELEHSTWLLLGEAVSKTEHIAGVPLDPDAAKMLHAVYLAKGVLATTAIEGNTLTEDEVRDHLEGRLKLPPSRQYLGQEIDNIVEACNRIGQEIIRDGSGPISVQDILEYNKLVLRELPLQEDVMPGELRRHAIVVGRYRGAPAEDCEFLLNTFCDWLNSLEFPKGLEQSYSILAAIAAHLYLVWIHPFGKGSPTHLRRRRLVLELSKVTKNEGWVRVSDIPNLTSRLAREYGARTSKTLSRDLNAILKMNLIERAQRLVRANKHLILAFLPARAPGDTDKPQSQDTGGQPQQSTSLRRG